MYPCNKKWTENQFFITYFNYKIAFILKSSFYHKLKDSRAVIKLWSEFLVLLGANIFDLAIISVIFKRQATFRVRVSIVHQLSTLWPKFHNRPPWIRLLQNFTKFFYQCNLPISLYDYVHQKTKIFNSSFLNYNLLLRITLHFIIIIIF